MQNRRRFTHTLLAVLFALSPAAAWAQNFGRLACEEACHDQAMEVWNDSYDYLISTNTEEWIAHAVATSDAAGVYWRCVALDC
ncbi:MAG: hypothetical protein OXJ54_12170 [Gemmatimonadetes bacterium]|nr:hypothetical protein [Candidatus Palauibacter rhopaloidicola]